MEKSSILIVDDEELNLYFLREALQDYDLNIKEACNGQKAVDACNEDSDIKLILMDIKMPVMDGLEATKIIKTQFPEIKIVAQTAYAFAYDKEKAIAIGCNEFITKPVSITTLADILSRYELI